MFSYLFWITSLSKYQTVSQEKEKTSFHLTKYWMLRQVLCYCFFYPVLCEDAVLQISF